MKEHVEVLEEDTEFYIDFYFPQKNEGFWSRLQTSLDTREEALEKMEKMHIDRATNKRVVEVYTRTSIVLEPDHKET